AVGRPAAAARDRPRDSGVAADPHSRRGDQQSGHRERAADPGVDGRSARRPDHVRDRAPAVDDPPCRSDPVDGEWGRPRARHARGADARTRGLLRNGQAADGIARARRRPGAAVTADATRVAFIKAATWHGSLEEAEALLAKHPELAAGDIHTAAILGDDRAVQRLLAEDRSNATAKSPPYGGDALNYLGLSQYLRLDPARTPAFLRAATALLDAGADPNTGFWTTGQFPERETALYGAAGVAHHAELT